MRTARRFHAIFFSLLFALPCFSQQTSANPAPTAQRDAEAIAVLSQILHGAGGIQAISAVQDVSASGTVSYNWGNDPVQGTVTIKGRGANQFRIDASLPEGTRTWAVNHGRRFEKEPDGTVKLLRYLDPASFQNILFPWAHLVAAWNGGSLSYLGLENRNGESVHHISVTGASRSGFDATEDAKKAHTIDLFVDSKTGQVQSVISVAYSTDFPIRTCAREIAYSDFRPISGVVVPFSITESVCGQQTMTIQLGEITFNNNLNDSDFQTQD